MFKKSLADAHYAADALGKRAIDVFHALADDLHSAADQHNAVVVQAQAQIDELTDLRDNADDAAVEKRRQAYAITSLVS